jgi:hypothetical protein
MVEVRWAGNAVPETAVESWGTVPVAGAFGACEGVTERCGGASIFMALDSWGCTMGLGAGAALSMMISMS